MEALQLEAVVVVTRSSLFKILVSLFLVSNSLAEKLAPKAWKTKLLFNLYAQSSNNGAQVYDGSGNEDAFVFEPMLFLTHQIDETTNVSAHITFDVWTAESDTILDENTGQSGEGIGAQTRTSGKFSASKEIGKSIWTPRLGFSTEYDYRSFNAGLNWTGLFAEDNFTLSIGTQAFMDSVKQFNYTTELTGEFQDKEVYSLDISGSQLLTRNDVISFGYTYITQSGVLESIRNTTPSGSGRVPENLPDLRERHALYSQWVHAFNDDIATSIKYRFYKDSWDLDANTIETSLRLSTNEEEGYLEFNYRFHDQTQVEYFTRYLTTSQEFHTADSDLEAFSSHRFGALYSLDLGEKEYFKFGIDNLNLSASTYYYFRSNDLSYITTQFGLGLEF